MNEYSSIYLFFSPTSNQAGQGSREVMWEVVQCIISISDEWRSDPLVTVPQKLRYMKKSNKGECNLYSELGCCLWKHFENYKVVLLHLPGVFWKAVSQQSSAARTAQVNFWQLPSFINSASALILDF